METLRTAFVNYLGAGGLVKEVAGPFAGLDPFLAVGPWVLFGVGRSGKKEVMAPRLSRNLRRRN
jgi:hypothetical protein